MKPYYQHSQGQVTVEYILLIMVVITIALGIGGPMGKHLKDFSGAMLGPDGYYGCLTKEGMLPGQSVSATACAHYSALAIGHLGGIGGGPGGGGGGPGGGGGGPGGGGGGPGGGGSGGGGSSGGGDGSDGNGSSGDGSGAGGRDGSKGKKSHRQKIKKGKSGSGSSDSSSSLIGGSAGDDSLARSSERQKAFALSSKGKKSKKRKNKRKKRHKALGGEEEGAFFEGKKSGHKRTTEQDQAYGAQGFLGEQIVAEEQKERQETFKALASTGKRGSAKGEEKKVHRIPDRAPAKDSALPEDDGKGLDFSGFMKYLVIIIMIIAIIMVIFSQVMEYQSRE